MNIFIQVVSIILLVGAFYCAYYAIYLSADYSYIEIECNFDINLTVNETVPFENINCNAKGRLLRTPNLLLLKETIQ